MVFSEVFLAPSYSPDSIPQSYPKLCSRKSAVVHPFLSNPIPNGSKDLLHPSCSPTHPSIPVSNSKGHSLGTHQLGKARKIDKPTESLHHSSTPNPNSLIPSYGANHLKQPSLPIPMLPLLWTGFHRSSPSNHLTPTCRFLPVPKPSAHILLSHIPCKLEI